MADTKPTEARDALMELATSDVAKLAGVKPYLLRKWAMRGDLKLAPHGYAGAGRGNENHWTPEAVAEVLARAAEKRTSGRRRALARSGD